MVAYIFQGNPNIYNIDAYIKNHKIIYWTCNRYKKEVLIGDDAFIWRAGKNAGLIAIGRIINLPQKIDTIADKEALGKEFWLDTTKIDDTCKIGIQISEFRISKEDNFLSRELLKENLILKNSIIIKTPNSTVFRMNDQEQEEIIRLWKSV